MNYTVGQSVLCTIVGLRYRCTVVKDNGPGYGVTVRMPHGTLRTVARAAVKVEGV